MTSAARRVHPPLAALALATALALLAAPGRSAADGHPSVSGTWLAEDGPCAGGTYTVTEEGGAVTSLRFEATCQGGQRVAWAAEGLRWESAQVLAFELRLSSAPAAGWADGSARLVFDRARGATLRWRTTSGTGAAQLTRPGIGSEADDETPRSCRAGR